MITKTRKALLVDFMKWLDGEQWPNGDAVTQLTYTKQNVSKLVEKYLDEKKAW